MSFLHLDPVQIITGVGYIGIFSIAFAESGLFFGFFLPGDSLLFTAGLLAVRHIINIEILLFLVPLAAILGDSVGYWFGTYIGPRLFTKQNSLFFDQKHADRARLFYEKHGPMAIVLARFIPVVRTFVPIIAGVGHMRYRTFLIYNIIGGILWSTLLLLLGYFLGRTFPAAGKYLLPLVLVIVVFSFVPVLLEWLRSRKK